jgi:lactoylglutathione lyase
VTLFTEDLAAAIAFYRTLLQADPHWGDEVSSVFKLGETMVNLLQISAVPELINPAPMVAPGARAVYTLGVADVDAEAARLTAAGLSLLNGPMDRPWGDQDRQSDRPLRPYLGTGSPSESVKKSLTRPAQAIDCIGL